MASRNDRKIRDGAGPFLDHGEEVQASIVARPRGWTQSMAGGVSLVAGALIKPATVFIGLVALVTFGCKAGSEPSDTSFTAHSDRRALEKVKPAPGTGNVQGKVLFNSRPAANIEVKLCETFSQYLTGCGGRIYTVRTDKDGEYVLTNVPPQKYEGLTTRVFDTDMYVFATGEWGLSSVKYDVVADNTLFVAPLNLFKADLKTVSPAADSSVSGDGLELKWERYPAAAYYKFSTHAEDSSVTSPYVSERVEGTSFSVKKPMPKGTYRFQVTAYNRDDRKLAQSSSDIKFTVQ